MKRDIQNRQDIQLVIDSFYEKLLADPLMAPIFTEVAQTDLSEHLPILYDFWETILFQATSYRRNAMEKHLELNRLFPLEKKHFDRWLSFFDASVDAYFEGETAHLAKTRALSIATVMKIKIHQAKM